MNIENKQVQKCVCRCYGHTHEIVIQLQFDCCSININPKRNWFSSKGFNKLGLEECLMPFYDLFDVFDIDCEDGANFEDISKKYCRLHINEDRDIVAIQHITKDILVLTEDLR